MKKDKIILTIIIIVFMILTLIGLFIIRNKLLDNFTNKNLKEINNKSQEKIVQNNIDEQKGIDKENKIPEKSIEDKKQERIKAIKEKLATKGLIVSGDINLKNDEYIIALKKFFEANKKTKNNPKVLSKIAETYFLMKNFKESYKYYSKITDKNYINQDNKVLSFLYSQNIENNNFNKSNSGSLDKKVNLELIKIIKNIKELNLEKEEEFYYVTSIECIIDFHSCKLKFENFFKNINYSGKNPKLENIRTAIDNYKKSKIEELYYKNSLIIGALLKNKNYPIAIILGKQLLKEKENYKPILKIIAQSYFNLGKLDEAYNYLLEYSKIDNKSADVSYMIGVITGKKQDYIKSNIFLNLALEQGYQDKESIYRLQLYNYLILGEDKKISETFDKIIIAKEKPNFTDLVLATYYNIINNNLEKAGLLTNKGIKLYPNKEDFYGFKAWLLIEKNEFEQAEELLKKANDINPRNALIVLNNGRVNMKKYEKFKKPFYKSKAIFLFKKTIELDGAEIGKLAKKYLENLK